MALADLRDWLAEQRKSGTIWYLKRLSGNDTLANESHQAGPYIPKDLLFEVFPSLNNRQRLNPDIEFDAFIDSHADHRRVRAIWYNNRFFGKTRNETRVTNWGGSSSALLDADSTGSLAVFVFAPPVPTGTREVHIWVCDHATEEDIIEERIATVEPGQHIIWRPDETEIGLIQPAHSSCFMPPERLPQEWLRLFPAPIEIMRKVCELRPLRDKRPDERLSLRRKCEFELFRSIEEATEQENLRHGFNTISDFIGNAQRILQRRKSRSGKSLELHLKHIFTEEGLREGEDFSHNTESELGKTPDFLFPSGTAYRDSGFPETRLRMLAAKTTCKDRWRQILREANRIPVKHLLTLQEGVSMNQYAEMKDARVQLVIPSGLVEKFPEAVQQELLTLENFIESVRHLRILD